MRFIPWKLYENLVTTLFANQYLLIQELEKCGLCATSNTKMRIPAQLEK